jgi:hypothetical protein
VAERLFVSRVETAVVPHESFVIGTDIALTGSRVDDLDVKVSGQGKEALEIHVHVLSNGAWTGIPTPNVLDQGQRERVNGRGNADAGASVQTGEASSCPHQIGGSNW